jgi:predicted Zn-dependent protease
MLRLPLLLLTAIFALAACSTQTAPVTGREQHMLVSEASVIQAASAQYRNVTERTAADHRLNVDASQTARVRRIAGRIIAAAAVTRPDTAAWHWEINVARDPRANAWCMAGGKMMVYSGIIDRLRLTDGELAAVIAHETAHAVAQHQREMISDRAFNDATNRQGDPLLGILQPSLTDPQVPVLVSVFMVPYTREKEAEADRIGLTLMARAGFDPYAMAALFQKLDADAAGRRPEFLSNHPSNAGRVAAIERAIAADPELRARAGGGPL